MTLLITLIVAIIVIGIGLMFLLGDIAEGLIAMIFMAIISAFAFILIQGVGGSMTQIKETVTYPVKIVSIKDGSQVEGNFYGGFISRGQIGETQYFSYYKQNADGSYALEKKEADRSVVFADATPETARVDITDEITRCEARWWLLCDETTRHGVFVHGAFHVPAGSVKNDFTLDAQ